MSSPGVRPARTASRTTSGAGDGRAYPSGAQLLAVVWAPWRRQFTVFGRFAPVPVVIDEADHDELFNRMRAAELPFAHPWRRGGIPGAAD